VDTWIGISWLELGLAMMKFKDSLKTSFLSNWRNASCSRRLTMIASLII